MGGGGAALKVTVVLADAAQVADGKLYLMGGGWTHTGPSPVGPMALAVLVTVPWDELPRPHRLELRLVDEDGRPVALPGPEGPAPIRFETGFELGRPAVLRPGTPAVFPLAVNFGPLPLTPGAYRWEVSVDGRVHDHWQVAFTVRDAPPGATTRPS